MVKVLITGVSGLLGRYLYHYIGNLPASEYGCNVRGTWFTTQVAGSHYRMDITNRAMVETVMYRFAPNIVIHCAGSANVDYCEEHCERSRHTNVDGTFNVATVAEDLKAKFVYISSNAVYKGDAPPYKETDSCMPVNKYGWQKLDAEEVVVKVCTQPLIVRPIMLYGWQHPMGRDNWVTRMLLWSIQDRDFKLVSDVLTQPTYAGDLASSIWALASLKQSGIWNIGGSTVISLYGLSGFVFSIFERVTREGQITPVTSDFFKSIAPRPMDTTFDMTKLYDFADENYMHKGALIPGNLTNGLSKMRGDALK